MEGEQNFEIVRFYYGVFSLKIRGLWERLPKHRQLRARVSLNATQISTGPQDFEANSIHTLKSKYQHTLRGPKDIITIKMVSRFLLFRDLKGS